MAKGALWAAPAVVVASSAPAFAASVYMLDFVMDTADTFVNVPPVLPVGAPSPTAALGAPSRPSVGSASGAQVRLGIANVGTTTMPAGQQFRVTFNVTGSGSWTYNWFRPGPGFVYLNDAGSLRYTNVPTATRVFTLNVPLKPGEAISMTPAILDVVGISSAALVAEVLPTTGVSVQGNTLFTINNILLDRAAWVIDPPLLP